MPLEATPKNDFLRIGLIVRDLCVKVAVCPAAASEKKRRIMFLYERRIITSGDVERIFVTHNLMYSEA